MTGGSSGVGMATWRELALAGASLHIFHPETVSKQITWYEVGQMKRAGHTKVHSPLSSTMSAQLDVTSYEMDMSSMVAIRTAVADFLAEHDGAVDVLIHNAAVACSPLRRTLLTL